MQTDFEGTARALLFRKVVFDYSRTYYAYQPFEPGDLPGLNPKRGPIGFGGPSH